MWSYFSRPHLLNEIVFDYSTDYSTAFFILLLVPKVFIFVACAYYTFSTRNIYNIYNESKPIFILLWNCIITCVCFLLVMLSFSDRIRYVHFYFGGSCAILFMTVVCYSVIFLPKIFEVLYPPITSAKNHSSSSNSVRKGSIMSSSSTESSLHLKGQNISKLESLLNDKEYLYRKKNETLNAVTQDIKSKTELIISFRNRISLRNEINRSLPPSALTTGIELTPVTPQVLESPK